MKKIIKLTGLTILIIFSFFYTDKVTKVLKENDSLMTQIKEVKDEYKILSKESIINNNTIIPGMNGKVVNVDKSYKKMREKGIFDENLIVYDKLIPKNNLNNNKDKFIISGNRSRKMVSIIFILDNNKYLDKVKNITYNKNIIINYFVDYKYLINNGVEIKEIENSEIYNYGNNGEYTPDNIIFANNIISRLRNNEAKYCLSTNKNEDVLELCSNNNLSTIEPSIIINNNPYNKIKKELKNGSIILMKLTNNNAIELGIIADYIRGKGLNIVGLSELLNEDYS